MNYAKQTLEKIADYESRGYEIVENANWKYPFARCRHHMDIVRLAQTNSRYHGRPERIVWAQREYTPEEMTAVENIRLIAQKITASGECPWAYMRDSYVEEYPEWDHAVEILGIERALIILRA